MDLSAMVESLLKITQQIQLKSSSSQTLTLDRTLGTVASIGLTVGVYRLLQAAVKAGGGKIKSSGLLDLIRMCLRTLLIGNDAKMLKHSGDEYFFGEQQEEEEDGDECWTRMRGACHCKTVSFVLRAKKTMKAKDCQGKIRYPHYSTTADNFQLMTGSRYLSVYYVNLASNENGHMIAAHTFCSRCGVHILRALNSNSNRLEVNTNCLEDRTGVEEIKVEGDLSGTSLGSGKALERLLKPLHELDNESRDSSWMEDEEFLQRIDKSKMGYNIETPATSSSTLFPGDTLLTTPSEYDDVSTLRSTEAPSTLNEHYNSRNVADRSNAGDNGTISGWAVSSSLQSVSPRMASDGTISLPPMPLDKRPNPSKKVPPSAVLKDQLQFYMKKHRTASVGEEDVE